MPFWDVYEPKLSGKRNDVNIFPQINRDSTNREKREHGLLKSKIEPYESISVLGKHCCRSLMHHFAVNLMVSLQLCALNPATDEGARSISIATSSYCATYVEI